MAKRILVIDDEADIRLVARTSLELIQRWEVLEADSGPSGIEIARQARPDAVVLDVMMPGMDGTETFRRLKAAEATKDIPVVFLTAKVQPAERAMFETVGARGVLAKPFDPMTLGAELERILGWSE